MDRLTVARLGVGIIGAGWMAEQHVIELLRRDDVEIQGVSDLDRGRAAALASSCGARPFAERAEMVEAIRPDALWVCTPPSSHADVVADAFAHGIPVYLEKPIARTLADGRLIAAAAADSGVVCAVGYQWHALDLLPRVHEALQGRPIGFILGKNIGATKARPWFVDRAIGGGNVLERASHHIDLIRLLAGKVASVQVGTSSVSLGGRPLETGDVEDALSVVLHLESGALATVLVVWLGEGLPTSYGLEIAADGAFLRIDLDPDFVLDGTVAGSHIHHEASSPALRSSIDRFLAAARAGDQSLVACQPADALRTLAVAQAAEAALASGETVPVPVADVEVEVEDGPGTD